MCYEPPVPPDTSHFEAPAGLPGVAIDVTPLLGARSGIGNAVGEIVAALREIEPRTSIDSVHVELARPHAARRRTRRDTLRAVAGPRAALVVGARRCPAHRPLAAAGARRPRDELSGATESPADARQRLRLLVRAVSRAVHAGGSGARADRAAGDRPGRDGAHELGVRRGRDRGDVRRRACARRSPRRDPARSAPARRRGPHAGRRRPPRSAARRSCSRSRRSSRARTFRTSSAPSACSPPTSRICGS